MDDKWFHPDALLAQLPIEKGAVVYFHYSMTCLFHTRCMSVAITCCPYVVVHMRSEQSASCSYALSK